MSELSRNQDRLITSLLIQPTLKAAAKEIGVCESTARAWYRLPEFKKAYADARRELVSEAIGALQQAGNQAVATLVKLLDATNESVRCTAASKILDLIIQDRNETRLTLLEQRLDDLTNQN